MLASNGMVARRLMRVQFVRFMSSPPTHNTPFPASPGKLPSWATVDPWALSAASPHAVKNLLNGEWVSAKENTVIVDPMNGEAFITVPETSPEETTPFWRRPKAAPSRACTTR